MDEPAVFYRIDSSRVTLREYAWGTKSPVALLLATILKLFRVQIASATDDPNVQTLSPFQVEANVLPEATRERFATMQAKLTELGFGEPIYHAIDDSYHKCKTYLATSAHQDGEAIARIHNRLWAIRTPPKDVLFHELLTEYADGTYLWSLSSKPDMLAPTCCRIVRKQGADAAELWSMHWHQVEQDKSAGRSIVPVRDRDQLIALTERHHAGLRNFHIHRRVFATLTEDQKKQAADLAARQKSGVPNAEILAELDKLQNKRTHWASAIFILVISMGLFIGAGRTLGPWRFVWLLIPILLFHEGGHYVAMRIFGYRNLRMFFIPFLGAAVSGRNYTAPGWKKVIVALMGPLPGILFAGLLGGAGLYLNHPVLIEAAVLALILNGLNLLPVLPLDGGRVMHTLFFSRHYLLDVGFRILAAGVLLGCGFWIGDKVLMFLGFFMLIGIPPAYRVARIASDLRRAGLGTRIHQPAPMPTPVEETSPSILPNLDYAPAPAAMAIEDQFIPTDVAQTIIDKIKSTFKRGLPNRVVAQHTLAIYEAVATRPPGVAATIGFSALHGFALLLAVALAAGLLIQQMGGLQSLRAARALRTAMKVPTPKYTLNPADVTGHRGISAQLGGRLPQYTVVATFPDLAASQRAFDELRPVLPPTASILRLGNSVLISLYEGGDEQRRKWLEQMKRSSSDVVVAAPNLAVSFSIHCTARDVRAAHAIHERLEEYLQVPAEARLIPPWSPNDKRSPDQLEHDRRARRTYLRLDFAQFGIYNTDEFAQHGQKLAQAVREGDQEAITRIQNEQMQRMAELRKQAIDRVRADSSNDPQVIADYVTLDARISPAERAANLLKLGKTMGQIEPPDSVDRFGATGAVGREGAVIQLRWMIFADLAEGSRALIDWLDQQGCQKFQYEFHSSGAISDDSAADEPN